MICTAVRFDGTVNEDSHVGGSGDALQANWISNGIFGDGEGEGGMELGVIKFFASEEEEKRRKREKNVRGKYFDVIELNIFVKLEYRFVFI